MFAKALTSGCGFQLLEFFFSEKNGPKPTEETENLRCRSHGEKTGRAEDELGGSLVMEPALRVGDVEFP